MTSGSSPAVASKAPFHLLYMIDEMKALTDGGTERQLLQMIRMVQERGARVQLCTLRGTEWLTSEAAGCPVHSADVGSVLALGSLWQLSRWMRRQRFDILQTFFVDANMIGPWLGRWAGVRTILGSRRNLNYWMTPRQRQIQRLSNRLTTRLVANCQAVRESTSKIEALPLSKIDVLYNGLDTDHFRRDESLRTEHRQRFAYQDEHLVIGMVAVLRPVKGCELFVEAAALVAARLPQARFLLVGDGPLREALQRQAEALGLAGRLIFTGSVDDVRGALSAMDIGVLCSDSEGFSNSVLEYLSMALPAVVTDVGGNAEAVGDAGRVVPPRNPQKLGEILVILASDSAARQRLSQAARVRAKDFSLPKIGDEVFSYYLALLESP